MHFMDVSECLNVELHMLYFHHYTKSLIHDSILLAGTVREHSLQIRSTSARSYLFHTLPPMYILVLQLDRCHHCCETRISLYKGNKKFVSVVQLLSFICYVRE